MTTKKTKVDFSARASYRTREAVRAVVTDDKGSVPLLHATARNYYKLPGGGIDEGEDWQTALARELKEEIGASAEVCHELGQVIEWKDTEKLKQISPESRNLTAKKRAALLSCKF